MKYQSTKLFDGYSIAVRQWKAKHSHCQLLHGYGVYFHITFESIDGTLDEMNWVQDYGSFKQNGLLDWLKENFDHTTLIEKDDPFLPLFQDMAMSGICKLVVMEKMGMETVAKMIFEKFNERLALIEGGRVKVVRVEAFEHNKNSAIYCENNKINSDPVF